MCAQQDDIKDVDLGGGGKEQREKEVQKSKMMHCSLDHQFFFGESPTGLLNLQA